MVKCLLVAKHGTAKQFAPSADFVFHHTLTSACFPCLPSDVADNDARNEYRESDGFDRPLPHLGLVLETWAEGRDVSLSTAEMPWEAKYNVVVTFW